MVSGETIIKHRAKSTYDGAIATLNSANRAIGADARHRDQPVPDQHHGRRRHAAHKSLDGDERRDGPGDAPGDDCARRHDSRTDWHHGRLPCVATTTLGCRFVARAVPWSWCPA